MIMKHLKLYAIALLALALLPSYSRAADSTVGKIQALIVSGDVKVKSGTAEAVPLKHNDFVKEGDLIMAGKDGTALLAFSNGATIRVTPNAQMAITKYKQDKYDEDAEGTFLRLSKDPSKSDTELDLRNGTLQGEVKQLNNTAGSKFTVNTPAGSAGIRGTVVSITVVRNAAGVVTGIVANCLTGSVQFTPSTPTTSVVTSTGGTSTTVVNNAQVGSGAQLSVNIQTDASGNPVSATVGGSGVDAAAAQSAINDVYAAINAARAAGGLAPVAAPTITATSSPTVNNGTSSPPTVTLTLAPTTAPVDIPLGQNPGSGGGTGGGGNGGSGNSGNTGNTGDPSTITAS